MSRLRLKMSESFEAFGAELVRRLVGAGARDEALADHIPPSRTLGFLPRPARMVPRGRVWRLGGFLLMADGVLLRTGRVVRVAGTDRRRSVVADTITERHELARAARRGGYAEGETVNFDARPVDLAASGVPDLEAYLAERAELLIHPPQGA